MDGGLLTAVPEDAAATTYDRQAGLYDRIVGSAPYNRAVWSASPADYEDFTRVAVADGAGPFLDAGCGTLVFTAAVYRAASRRLVLTDRSAGMLARARRRLGGGGWALLQADLYDLPFRPGSFTTVGSFGVLHCLDELDGALAALHDQLAPGGRLFASSLVAATPVGRRVLGLLQRAGEAGPPRSEEEFTEALTRRFAGATVARRGSMAYATARRA